MSKRILIDARMYGLENTGIGRYLINLIKELSSLKTEEQFRVLLREKYFSQLDFPPNWKKVLADFGHYTFEEQLRLPRLIRSEDPDIVHFPHLNTPLFWKGRFIVTIHDLTMQRQRSDATSLPLPIYYFKRIPFLINSRNAVLGSEKIIVPTQTVKNDIIAYYKIDGKKIKVINEGYTILTGHNNADSLDILNKYKIKTPYFIYVGNAYPHKNLKKAMEAVISLNIRTKRDVALVIGGSKNIFTKRLAEEVRDIKGEKYINLVGYVEDRDLKILMKNSLGFVYPSLAEGYGLQGLESMEAGTIVMASNIPVFKEIYGDNAFYFDPKDTPSISNSMEHVMNMDNKKRNLFISRSKKFITKYSWSKMAKETFSVYESCISL